MHTKFLSHLFVFSDFPSLRDETELRENGCEKFSAASSPNLLCNQSPQPLFNQNRDGYRLEYLLRRFGLRDVATGRMAS